jgi:hypothetical protein
MSDTPDGAASRKKPAVSEQATRLLQAVQDTYFACGEWTKDDDEPYEALYQEAEAAETALRQYIATLEVGR